MTSHKHNSCERKAFYGTESEAAMAAMRTRSFEDQVAHAYKCKHCPGYHVGHKIVEVEKRDWRKGRRGRLKICW